MAQPRGQRSRWTPLALGLLAALGLGACSSERLDRGDVLLGQGKYAEAIQAWQQALATHPRDATLLVRIATAEARLDRLDDAEATLQRAIALEPQSPKVRHNLGLVYLKQKKLDQALAAFQEVLALEATYPTANYYVGLIHEMRGDEKTARDYYVREVNHGPCVGAWDRLWELNERDRRPGPSKWHVILVSLGLLAFAAGAYGLRVYLDARRGRTSGSQGAAEC